MVESGRKSKTPREMLEILQLKYKEYILVRIRNIFTSGTNIRYLYIEETKINTTAGFQQGQILAESGLRVLSEQGSDQGRLD